MRKLKTFDTMVQQLKFEMLCGDERAVRKVESHVHEFKRKGYYLSFVSVKDSFERYYDTFHSLCDANEVIEGRLEQMGILLKKANYSFNEWNNLNKELKEVFKSFNEESQDLKKQLSFVLYLSKQYLIQKAVLDSKDIEDKRAMAEASPEKTYAEVVAASIDWKKQAHGRSIEIIKSLNAEILQILLQGENSNVREVLAGKTKTLQDEITACAQLQNELYEAVTADNRIRGVDKSGLASVQLDLIESENVRSLLRFKKTLLAVSRHPFAGKWIDGDVFNSTDLALAESVNEAFKVLLEEPNKKILV